MKAEAFYKFGNTNNQLEAGWAHYPRYYHQDEYGDGDFFGYDKSSKGSFRYFLIMDRYGWGPSDNAKKIQSSEFYSAYKSMVSSILSSRDIDGTGDYFKRRGLFGHDIFYKECWDGVIEKVEQGWGEIVYERDKMVLPLDAKRITWAEYEDAKRKVINAFKSGKLPKREDLTNF